MIFRYPVFKNNVAGKEKIIILRRESRDFRVLRIPRGFRVLRGPRIVFVSLKDLVLTDLVYTNDELRMTE